MRYYRSEFGFSPAGGYYFRGGIKWLIIANLAVFMLQTVFRGQMEPLFGLVPAMVLKRFMIWQVFTYMFLHGGFFHLLLNMFVIWMFGRSIESRWGTASFITYYFFTGLGAALLTLLLTPHQTIPTIGASGAVYGLLVAFAMMYPQATVYLYFFIPVTAWQMVLLFAVIEFFASISGTPDGIARFAHLGGMLFGYLYLAFGDRLRMNIKNVFKHAAIDRTYRRKEPMKTTADLAEEVNQILDKILVKGPGSLTKKEENIMKEYAAKKKT